jgi:hypothetical protein
MIAAIIGIVVAFAFACRNKQDKRAYFEVNDLTLYQPDAVLAERLGTVDAFGAYVNTVRDKLSEFWENNKVPQPMAGVVVVGIKPPSQSRFWLILPVEQRAEFQLALNSKLKDLPVPPVKNGGVAVAINFTLGDITPPVRDMKQYAPPMPEEWSTALKTMTEPEPLPDCVFNRIWKDN